MAMSSTSVPFSTAGVAAPHVPVAALDPALAEVLRRIASLGGRPYRTSLRNLSMGMYVDAAVSLVALRSKAGSDSNADDVNM
jgi:hypothetical protein